MGRDPEDLSALVASGRIDEAARLARRNGRLVELAGYLPDVPARVGFLHVDLALVRLLEDAIAVTTEPALGARLRAKLAFELRGDPTSLERRAQLLGTAERDAPDDRVAAEVMLARIHALDTALRPGERLDLAERTIELLRSIDAVDRELEARLARFHALLDLGRVLEAEVELGRYEQLGGHSPHIRAFVESRRSMLALLRGRYDDALHHGDRAHAAALDAGMPDADKLLLFLQGAVAMERHDRSALEQGLEAARGEANLLPGQHWDASIALLELISGNNAEARAQLVRAMPALRRRSGWRWLGAACEAARVAAVVGSHEQVAELHDALLPHRHELTFFGPPFSGTVTHALAVLEVRLGLSELAIEHGQEAVRWCDDAAALGWAARARATVADALDELGRPHDAAQLRTEASAIAGAIGMTWPLTAAGITSAEHVWHLRRDGDGWTLVAGGEQARLPASRGLAALATLVANPRQEIAAITLDGGDVHAADRPVPTLDDTARAAYRRRLRELEDLLDRADRNGDPTAAARHAAEREAIVRELRRATGLGGRDRQRYGDAERARVNVTRNLKRAIDRIGLTAPAAAEHLATSIRTGAHCRYEAGPTGPDRWYVEP